MRERHLIAFLTTVQFMHMVDFVLMMPMGPMLMRELQVGAPQFAWMLSAYTFAAAIAGVLSGFFIDRFDRRTAMLVGLFAFSIATIACGLAPDHLWMIAARALAGFCGGFVGALIFSIVPDAIPPERRGRALGLIMGAFSIASIVGIPIGITLAVKFGWHAPFLSLGGASLGVVVWAWCALPSMRNHIRAERPKPLATLQGIFGRRTHLEAFALSITMVLAGFTVIPFLSPYLVGNVGFSDDQLKYVYLCGGLAAVMTTPLIGRLSDRLGARPVFVVVGGLSIIPLLLVTNLPPVGLPLTLVATTLFIILVSGRFVPAMTLITNSVDPRQRGSFMGFHGAIQSLAMGLAAQLSGLLVIKAADGHLDHYPRVGWIAAGCTAFAIILSFTLKPAVPPPAGAEPSAPAPQATPS
jgi:predicted MFS family arabinose efflux permease